MRVVFKYTSVVCRGLERLPGKFKQGVKQNFPNPDVFSSASEALQGLPMQITAYYSVKPIIHTHSNIVIQQEP